MNLKWLAPSIEARTTEIFDGIVESDCKSNEYHEIRLLKDFDAFFELENVYMLSLRRAIEVAYMQGLRDMMNLK